MPPANLNFSGTLGFPRSLFDFGRAPSKASSNENQEALAKLFEENKKHQYPIQVDNKSITLCHVDKDGDGKYQEEQDLLLFKGADGFIQPIKDWTNNPLSWNGIYHRFQGLSLPKWYQLRKKIFPNGSKKEDELQLSEIIEHCYRNKIELEKVASIAAQIKSSGQDSKRSKAPTNSMENIQALMMVTLLLEIKGNSENPFYKTYKDFIDQVYANLKNLKLKSSLGSDDKKMIFDRVGGFYDPNTNTITFSGDRQRPNLTGGSSLILHELYHFYQDIKKEHLSIPETEAAPYLMEAAWGFHQFGEDSKKDEKSFLKAMWIYFVPDLGREEASASIYHQLKGRPEKAEEYRRRLVNTIALNSLTRTLRDTSSSILQWSNGMLKAIEVKTEPGQKISLINATYQKVQTAWEKEKGDYLALIGSGENIEVPRRQITNLILKIQALILLDQWEYQVQNNLPLTIPIVFDILPDGLSQQTKKPYQELFNLRLMNHLYIKNNGV